MRWTDINEEDTGDQVNQKWMESLNGQPHIVVRECEDDNIKVYANFKN